MSPRLSRDHRAIAFAAISCLLRYPDATLVADAALIGRAVETLPAGVGGPLRELIAHVAATPLLELQAEYVETFDLRRRNCLYLSYHNDGDTRRRGMALWKFADLYRRHGYSIAEGELADFLPAMLELAAEAAPEDTEPMAVLVAHQPGIALLGHSLADDGSPYAAAIAALESILPRPSAAALEAARLLEEVGPPAEQVGLEPFAAAAPAGVGR